LFGPPRRIKIESAATMPIKAHVGKTRAFSFGGIKMRIESEELYGALWQIGAEFEGEPLPRREILDRLAELKIVEVQPDGRPTLTEYGERCYAVMESGEGDIPEFEEPQPIWVDRE
jgi:hypothetical protein